MLASKQVLTYSPVLSSHHAQRIAAAVALLADAQSQTTLLSLKDGWWSGIILHFGLMFGAVKTVRQNFTPRSEKK